MPEVFVQRGAGDQRGEDIVDSLLTTIEACLARGRNELDEQSSGFQSVTLVIPFRPNLRAGQLIRVYDVQTSLPWLGKIVGVSLQYGATDIEATLNVLKQTVVYE